ncbi:hypothetical protein ACIQTT_06735 [Microbacterium sp. NPDC090225]|uniref:hypothetical protein n=1 Tax=Microbacterium sp. NPDC090225 TaxID=3364207 RepID=UPI0037FA14A8
MLLAASGASVAGCAAAEQPTPAATATQTPTPGQTAPATSYADGVYGAVGWYGSQPSHHDVTLGIEDGIVVSVDITTPAKNPTSLQYQQRFAEALPDAVIGQPLSTVSVDRLAGSSGCSEGFMAALADIREQASNEGNQS